jgi:hypothetical protein
MFGILKENILDKLEETYISEGEENFKKEFNKYIKTIKENKNLKEFYEVYDLFNQVNFDDEVIAKEFVEESINYLKQFDKSEIKKLETILESKTKKTLNEDTIEYKLDRLIFEESINLKDKVVLKVNLVKQLTNKEKKTSNYKETFEKLQTNINENIAKLSPNQTDILDLFVENDSSKINDYYKNLINETAELVDKKIVESGDINVAKKLLEVKIKLTDLKKETPNIAEIERIIELKESFN